MAVRYAAGAMDWEPTEPSLSFVIRLWREETAVSPEGAVWRGHVTHVPSGQKHYFQDVATLDELFESYLQPDMSIFSFDEPVDDPEEEAGGGGEPAAPSALALSALSMAPTLPNILAEMLAALQQATGLDPSSPVGSLPAADVLLLGVEEKVVGLGSLRGQESRQGFGPISLRGGRLLATVQCDVLADSPTAAAAQSLVVNANLLAARGRLLPPPAPDSALLSAVFLKVKASGSTAPEEVSSPAGWRRSTVYEVLYEYHYADADGAEGLIARIPVHADLEAAESPDRETSTVVDALARWDQNAAPALERRGPATISRLNALVFVPGAEPAGSVELLRTVAGAASPPAEFAALAEFLDAVADPDSPLLNARFVFPTLGDFLDALAPDPNPLTFGDWDEDSLPDTYTARSLVLAQPLRLRRSVDRFYVTFDPGNPEPRFDVPGVVYVRAD